MTTKSTYYYQVPLKYYREGRGSATTRDEHGNPIIQTVTVSWLVSDMLIASYIDAKDEEEAYAKAQSVLLERYPVERGYREHEKVKVKKIEEQA